MFRINKKYSLLFLIIILGAILRIYQLDKFPVHLNHDEVTQLYDAISIAQTGKDIYGNFMPTIFESVHDFKPPFYTYSTALLYHLFGGGETTIRLTSVFFGILMIPAVFLFVLKLLANYKIALLGAFFTAIAPFEIFFSRKSFENGAGIFFMLVGLSLFLSFIENKKRIGLLYLAVLVLSMGMYTYFSHAIIIPLLFISLLFIYKKDLLTRKLILPIIFWAVLLIPLFLIIVANPDSRYRSQTVFILQDPALGKQIEYTEKFSPIGELSRVKTILDYSVDRYLNQFNPIYLFGNGLDLTNHGPLGSGPLLFFQFPFLLIGIYFLVKDKKLGEAKKFMLTWIVLGMLPSGLTFEPHSPHRSVMVFTMLNIISAVGAYVAIGILKKPILIFILSVVLIFNLTYFIHIYTVNYAYEKSEQIHYPFKQIAQYAWSQHGNYEQIIFDPLFGQVAPFIGTAAHYYIAYYGNYAPEKFQKEYKLGAKDREVLFDKFSIRKVDWREDSQLKDVLIIASPWALPADSIDKSIIKEIFYSYDGKPAFYAIQL